MPLSPQPTPGGRPSHHASAVAARCSLANTAPSEVANSSRTPGSPVTGSVTEPRGGSGTPCQVRQPGAEVTVTSPPKASRRAWTGAAADAGMTRALPPPWITGCSAFGPITATRSMPPAASGSAAPSLCSSTSEPVTALRSSTAGTRSGGVGGSAPLGGVAGSGLAEPAARVVAASRSAPTRRATPSSLVSLSSTISSVTCPARTASARAGPQYLFGPGMARSSPPTAVGTVLRVASQSEVTRPVKPHSPLSTARSSVACSVILLPLTTLYAAMTSAAPPSRTEASNGTRYSSRSTCSPMRAS